MNAPSPGDGPRSLRRRLAAAACAVALAGLLGAAALLVWARHWGRGQLLTPGFVSARLAPGMTPAEAGFALGLGPSGCVAQAGEGGTACRVSEPGLGSLFAPQHGVALWFGQDGRLERATAEWVYRADDLHQAVPLSGDPRGVRPIGD